MNDLLQKLLEAEVLTDETKTELEEAFNTQVNEAIEAAKEEATATIRAELTEQFIEQRDTLIEAVDTKVGEFVEAELDELKEDLERFRDLEADYADKLVEAKASMQSELKSDLVELVEKINSFLEIRLEAELDELKEDIEEVQKNEMGRKIYEAFAEEFMMNFADEDDSEATLAETKRRLIDAEEALEEAEMKRSELEREIKLDEVLMPLNGRSREVMEAILKTVATDDLESGYKTFIGRVVRETKEVDSEKEEKVLAEGSDVQKQQEGVVVTGDDVEMQQLVESTGSKSGMTDQQRAELRRLAGI